MSQSNIRAGARGGPANRSSFKSIFKNISNRITGTAESSSSSSSSSSSRSSSSSSNAAVTATSAAPSHAAGRGGPGSKSVRHIKKTTARAAAAREPNIGVGSSSSRARDRPERPVLWGADAPRGRGKTAHPGLSGKTLGSNMAKRHRKVLRDRIHGITKPDIRRLARRGGVKRISSGIYDTVRSVMRNYLSKLIHESVVRCEYANRNTITVTDVLHSLRHMGRPIYGFDPDTYNFNKPAVTRLTM